MIKNITDPRIRCGAGACPGVYITDEGKLLIVGAKPALDLLNQLQDRVSEDELVIEIEPAFVQNLALPKRSSNE